MPAVRRASVRIGNAGSRRIARRPASSTDTRGTGAMVVRRVSWDECWTKCTARCPVARIGGQGRWPRMGRRGRRQRCDRLTLAATVDSGLDAPVRAAAARCSSSLSARRCSVSSRPSRPITTSLSSARPQPLADAARPQHVVLVRVGAARAGHPLAGTHLPLRAGQVGPCARRARAGGRRLHLRARHAPRRPAASPRAAAGRPRGGLVARRSASCSSSISTGR